MRDRQVEAGVTVVQVPPVDDAAQVARFVHQQVAGVEVAVHQRERGGGSERARLLGQPPQARQIDGSARGLECGQAALHLGAPPREVGAGELVGASRRRFWRQGVQGRQEPAERGGEANPRRFVEPWRQAVRPGRRG